MYTSGSIPYLWLHSVLVATFRALDFLHISSFIVLIVLCLTPFIPYALYINSSTQY